MIKECCDICHKETNEKKMGKAEQMENPSPQCIENLIACELMVANSKFPAFASTHEGWAVLHEEVQEADEDFDVILDKCRDLFKWIRADHKYGYAMELSVNYLRQSAVRGIEELIQVAAMCDKFKALGEPTKEQDEMKIYEHNRSGGGGGNWQAKIAPEGSKPEAVLLAPLDEIDRKNKRCESCKYYHWTPVAESPVCLNTHHQLTRTKATWSCPEWKEGREE